MRSGGRSKGVDGVRLGKTGTSRRVIGCGCGGGVTLALAASDTETEQMRAGVGAGVGVRADRPRCAHSASPSVPGRESKVRVRFGKRPTRPPLPCHGSY